MDSGQLSQEVYSDLPYTVPASHKLKLCQNTHEAHFHFKKQLAGSCEHTSRSSVFLQRVESSSGAVMEAVSAS